MADHAGRSDSCALCPSRRGTARSVAHGDARADRNGLRNASGEGATQVHADRNELLYLRARPVAREILLSTT